MRKSLRTSQSQSADINMSPLIDMVFLLLIFFMVTAVFTKDSGVNINRPTAQSAKPLDSNAIFFTIDASGDIKHAGQPYTIAQIPNLLAEINPAKQAPVTIIADRAVPTGLTIQLIDACQLAGLENIAIAANKK
ncbi:MAG TPA: biopolymer transporter ExbD [Lentisphaeria bacterium]|nr:biopolymer transporter ExbD [Lentisphaeria bacterium]